MQGGTFVGDMLLYRSKVTNNLEDVNNFQLEAGV